MFCDGHWEIRWPALLGLLKEIAVIYLHNVKREFYVLGSRNRRLVVAVLAIVEP